MRKALSFPHPKPRSVFLAGETKFYDALHKGVIASLKVGRRYHIYRKPYVRLLHGPPVHEEPPTTPPTPITGRRRARDERSERRIAPTG